MHEAVFEAGWKYEELMQQHRKIVSPRHQGKGKEIIALDWTFSYHLTLVIVHEKSDLSAPPRFLLTDALHWDAARVLASWSYRWSVEIFHEFSQQLAGFESAQLRNEEAVKRHFCLSCVAHSALQQASCSGKKSEKFNLTPENESTIGQRLYTLSREALHNLLKLSHSLLFQGQSTEQIILEIMGRKPRPLGRTRRSLIFDILLNLSKRSTTTTDGKIRRTNTCVQYEVLTHIFGEAYD